MPADLEALAYDMTWTWDSTIRRAFEHLDPALWRESGHNPVVMLQLMAPEARAQAVLHPEIVRLLARRPSGFPGMQAWGAGLGGGVAYFSMEYAITEHLPIYSGGLGVLAGDQLKAAAQLGLPITGVGLLYRTAFARQVLGQDGEQLTDFPATERSRLPIAPVPGDEGPAEIRFTVGADEAVARLWHAHVGSVMLILLDTDLPQNPPHIRAATERLYVADPEARLVQEIVLGIGGVRALRAAGRDPLLFHLNEGHSFLSLLELTREEVAAGRSLQDAREQVRRRSIFTTHTPVAAGSDYFPEELVARLVGPYLEDAGMTVPEFVDMGRRRPGDAEEMLCTTFVALREAGTSVGVSKLHGAVSRRLWKDAWPGLAEEHVPIGYVTNGVHMPTWVAEPIASLLAESVDEQWWNLDADDQRWRGVALIPDRRLWDIRTGLRRRLIERAIAARGDNGLFDPDKLTIGFARRFAGYKRAALMLSDPDRFRSILGRPGREVLVVVAGKAHPSDGIGKEILTEVARFVRDEPRMAFIEDYGLGSAPLLVQGADVWLNNPRRLLEASGTSGMKAGANGVLNLSVNDGWWDEGRRSDSGWTIEAGSGLDEADNNDARDADILYRTLEERVVPLFYDRDPNGIPSGWVAMMRASIRHIGSQFSARRMVLDYYRTCYLPAARLAARGDSGTSQTTASGGSVKTADDG
ncbi:MAG: alpha-glucan family phosphorylase [Candidatus Dormiibacterota bacterium]